MSAIFTEMNGMSESQAKFHRDGLSDGVGLLSEPLTGELVES